jgi:hypothetical protein
VAWHGTRLSAPDWGGGSLCLGMHLAGEHAPLPDCDVYLAASAAPHELAFELPEPPAGQRWLRVVATWRETPDDLCEPGAEEPVETTEVVLPPHSCLLLRSG